MLYFAADPGIRNFNDSTTNPPPGSTFAFYVNASSNVVVYDGMDTNVLTDTVVAPDTWTRFLVRSDYTTKRWDLYVNSIKVAAAEGLQFYSAGVSAFTEFGVISGGNGDPVELDAVNITLDPPPGHVRW
jgi:hypothetical protein